ncbi:MAG TPA: hypothetical protein PKZ97_18750 [Azospirillaceae bacterium]|nr:hypothetical protein [Azospirillaceae bacterium]
MALSSRVTPGFYQDLRRRIAVAAEQLETLRAVAERLPPARRREAEALLDRLRGLLNRALARLEAARIADNDPWRVQAARSDAQSAAEDLFGELAQAEGRLPLAA